MRKSVIFTYIKIFLVIAIIGVIIFFGIKFFNKEYDKEEFETIKTNMLLIQAKTELIAQKVDIEEKGAKYIGTKISEKKEDEKIKKLIDNKVIDIDSDKSNYYCIDNNNLSELGLNDIKIDDYYIIDYKKNDVIYIYGIKDSNGNIVYKLSEME
jgi:Tfp pilus assembly protein FimT